MRNTLTWSPQWAGCLEYEKSRGQALNSTVLPMTSFCVVKIIHYFWKCRPFCLFLTDWTLILVVAASTKPVSNPSTNSIQISWKTVTAKAVTGHKKNEGVFHRTMHTCSSCCKKHCVIRIPHDITLLHNGLRNGTWICFHKCTATRKLSWSCVYNFNFTISQLSDVSWYI